MKLIQFIFALVFIAFNKIIKFCIKRPGISLLLIFVLWVNSLPLPDEKIVIVKQDSLSPIEKTLTTQQSLAICGGKFVNPDSGGSGGYRGSTDQNPLDRGPDRNPYAGPRYAGDNNDFSSSGSGNGNNNPWENEDIPPKSDWKPDKDYWKKFHPDYEKKRKKDEVCEITEENKGGYDDLLIDLLPQGHRYDIEGPSARDELQVVAKDPKARKFLTNELDRIRDGTLTSIQQKELKGFKHLKEYKFGRKGVRVIVNPGKKGEPDVIVGIVRRDRATPFIKSLRNKFETTK